MFPLLSVVLDCAGLLEVAEVDHLDVKDYLDLVAGDHAAARDLVLPETPKSWRLSRKPASVWPGSEIQVAIALSL